MVLAHVSWRWDPRGSAELLPAPNTCSRHQVRAQPGETRLAGSWVILVL